MGVSTFDVVQAAAFIGSQFGPTQGKTWFVKPISGADGNSGKSPAQAFQTLKQAQLAATANQNDVVFFLAEGDAASATTDYQSATLTWAKDQVHLIGVNAGPLLSQRSRIAFLSTYAVASNLLTVSANGCYIANMEVFAGVASTLPTGGVSVSGERNHFFRCHLVGMGNTANDISGAYSLQLNGAEENLFEDCTIGVDTVQLGAGTSNSQILFSNNAGAACTRNWFRRCRILLDTNSATACLFLRSGATAQDRFNVFENCLFWNFGTSLTHAMAVLAGTSPAGITLLQGADTSLFGAGGWNTVSGAIYAAAGVQPSATTFGVAEAVTS